MIVGSGNLKKYIIPAEEVHLSTSSVKGKIEAIVIRNESDKVLVSIRKNHESSIEVEVEDGELVIDAT